VYMAKQWRYDWSGENLIKQSIAGKDFGNWLLKLLHIWNLDFTNWINWKCTSPTLPWSQSLMLFPPQSPLPTSTITLRFLYFRLFSIFWDHHLCSFSSLYLFCLSHVPEFMLFEGRNFTSLSPCFVPNI
jgi:hypothetical protein